MISQELLDILVCPKCKQPMEYRPAENTKDGDFLCKTCRLSYAVVDDLPNFIIEEATPTDGAATPPSEGIRQ